METAKQIREAFKAWCARMGLRPVSSVHVLSEVGDAALMIRGNRYTVEVATALGAGSTLQIAAGATHGYGYPLLTATAEKAAEFLGGAQGE